MNWPIFALDVAAIAGFSTAFYYSVKIYNSEKFALITLIRSTALFAGVIWSVLLAFSTAFGYQVLKESATAQLSVMGGLFLAWIMAKSN